MAQSATRRDAPTMPNSEPMVPWKPPGMEGHQFVPVSQRLYRERIVILGNFLDEEAANNLIAVLLYMKQEEPNKQISLYFNVPGALLKPTMAVYDTLKSMDCPIMTLNLGLATGMGAFLCAAGTKGLRFALPNARFLLQKTGLDDPFQGQAVDIGLRVSDNLADNKRMAQALAQMTGNTYDKVAEDLNRDFYLSAFEAREYGLVDKVLLPGPKSEPEELADIGGTKKKKVKQEVGFGAFSDGQSTYQGQGKEGGGYGGKTTIEREAEKSSGPPTAT